MILNNDSSLSSYLLSFCVMLFMAKFDRHQQKTQPTTTRANFQSTQPSKPNEETQSDQLTVPQGREN